MLLKISLRNIWRNKLRSGVVIIALVIGLWAALFMSAFSWGLYQGHIDDTIETYLSHLQIHHPMYLTEKTPEYTIPNSTDVIRLIRNDTRVIASSARVLASGMITSPKSVSGVMICGINPQDEFSVSTVSHQVVEGSALREGKKHEVFIGSKLAEKLNVKVKSKIVLTFQSVNRDMTAGSFRICGIFKTHNSIFDETTIFVHDTILAEMLGSEDAVHEIAVLLKDEADSDTLRTFLNRKFPEIQAQTWKDLSPELRLVIESFNEYMLIFIGIILLALMFGIINTMLMAVLERQREIGMLMAIGLNKKNIFIMIVTETLLLVCIGIPIGLLITYLSVTYFHTYGIDISIFSQGLSAWGFRSRVYTYLNYNFYIPVILLTILCALISSIYPAYRALQYRPSEAIRKI